MGIRLVFFLGLTLLIAGIFVLNAQEDDQASGDEQAASATAPAEKTAPVVPKEATPEVKGAAVEPVKITPAAIPAPEADASPKQTPAALPPAEASPALSVVKPEQAKPEPVVESKDSEKSQESKNGEKIAKDDKALEFEIDRGGLAAKETKTAEEKQESVVPKPAGKKQKSKGFFGGLFGSGREQKPEGADAGAGQKEDIAAGGDEQGVGVQKSAQDMTPEELLAVQEEVRRQASEVAGLKKLDQAYQEMSRKEFDKALVNFKDALNVMPLRPHTVETRQRAMMSEGECEYRLALVNYQEGKVREARENINRCLEYYPAHRGAVRLSERIKEDELERRRVDAIPVPLKKAPAYLDRQKTIKGEIKRGREYMAIKQYNDAENEFRSVLADEKLNPEASANLKKIAETRYNLETDEFQRMKAEMLAQIRDTWTPPIKRPTTGPRIIDPLTIPGNQARRRLEDKLKNIMIQKIEFVDANIESVISYLHQQSLVGDRDSQPGDKGVNILLRLNRSGQSAAPAAPAAAAADVFAAEDAKPAASTGAGGGNVPAITMTMRDISLMDAIKYITDIAGLKYRVDERVVIIHSPNIAVESMETRTYKVMPTTIEQMTGGAGGGAATATPATDDKMQIGQGASLGSAERPDIRKFLNDAGIPFPESTSIVYIPAPPLLIVKNTAENLESFESLLNKLNVATAQVAIEARFVEIGQSDLEELGLEWLLTDNWEIATKPNGERIQMNKGNITKGLRELNVSAGQIGTAVGGTMGNVASISSILTNPELTVILHALQQKDGVNLLSAPKVTTKSGSNAKIKVVEELIYPTEYQQQAQSIGTTTSGNQSLVQIVVTPSAFETRDLGVILDVTPTVGPDNETIDLVMLPQVVELSRWIDYGSDVPTGDVNRPQHITLLQPVFHCRDITTSISIWDGQTVVMGGLISEGQVTTEDQVPLLGDIPLLGYLFRSKTSKSIKKNLLIFVTANLVDPAGNKMKKDTGTSPLVAESGQQTTAR